MSDGGELRRQQESDLVPEATEALDEAVERWRSDVLAEAQRLAAGRQRGPRREPVTVGDIQEASNLLLTGARSGWAFWINIVGHVVSYACAILAGLFATGLATTSGKVGFVISVVVGVLAATAFVVAGRRGR